MVGNQLKPLWQSQPITALCFCWRWTGSLPLSDSTPSKRCFTIGYSAQRGIQFQHPPFDTHADQLTHPWDYAPSQALGSERLAAGVEAFQHRSARSMQSEVCAALYTTASFINTQPDTTAQWLCELTKTSVTFKAVASPRTYHYPLSQCAVDGMFPLPA